MRPSALPGYCPKIKRPEAPRPHDRQTDRVGGDAYRELRAIAAPQNPILINQISFLDVRMKQLDHRNSSNGRNYDLCTQAPPRSHQKADWRAEAKTFSGA